MTPQRQPGTGIREDADGPGLPRLADGAELAGEFVGAGYREPPLLVYRGDGQVVKLPDLLYRTMRALDDCYRAGGRPGHRLGDPAAAQCSFTDRQQVLAAVARTLSEETGREYAAGHVEFLLDKKLAPLGVTTFSDGSPPEVVKPQPMLSLTWKMTMLSERTTWFLAGLFTWLFRTPVLVCAAVAILAAETWMFISAPLASAMAQTIQSPGGILLVVALAVASTGFHEIGHGAACRYGGAAPGVTGCGLYLAWPVFYTDITNTYRLGRSGRLRADLGGVYFNGIFILGLAALYFATGAPVLLVAILSTSLEAVQQLLPTLRFDGYYIIADLVGIPDLFKYIGPILRRVLLRRPDDGRLAALKRWPQVIVTIWVILVVPALLGQLALLVYNFPKIVASDWDAIRSLAASSMTGGDPVLGVASAVVRILLLLFPLVGIALILFRLLRSLARFAIRRLRVLWASRRAAAAVPASVQSLLDTPEPERTRPLPADGDVPGPRHRTRRTGLALPLVGAAAVLGMTMIMAWALAPSVRQGTAADMRPDKLIGVPPAPAMSSVPRPPGAESHARQWRTGTAGSRPAPPSAARPPAATTPALPGPGDSSGQAGPGRDSSWQPTSGSSSSGRSSAAPSSYPGGSAPGGSAPSQSPSQSSGQQSPGQPSASQSQASSGQSPSQPSGASPSYGQPPSEPSSSAQWTPAPSQVQSQSQPDQPQPAQPQEGQSQPDQPQPAQAQPAQTGQQPRQSATRSQSAQTQSVSGSPPQSSPQPSADPAGSQSQPVQPEATHSPSATSVGCTTQVNLVLLELNGLCPQ